MATDDPLPLPEEFAASAGLSEEMHLLRTQIFERLKSEHEATATLDLIMLERTSFLYAHIRSKEATTGFAHDRAYKETTALLFQMLESLRKKEQSDESVEAIRTEIIGAVVEVMQSATASLSPEDRETVLATVLSGLGADE